MKKPWSLSTTVRNPERLRSFLQVLKTMEGEAFHTENQILFQILLIKNKLYTPSSLTTQQMEYFLNFEKVMPLNIAEEIFHAQEYVDPAMRGRQSGSILKKMGLCRAENTPNGIYITNAGEYFLSENYDLGKLFQLYFLKWQLPNPSASFFSERDGFSIKPFIATLHFIHRVNQLWADRNNEPIGISMDEFSLFVPTLIHYANIENQAEKLIEYRIGIRSQKTDASMKNFQWNFKTSFAASFLGTSSEHKIKSLLQNLRDYGDNAVRYFRLTRLLYIRGGGYYIDLEPRRSIELALLLKSDNASPIEFVDEKQYIEYLSDLAQPVLPWDAKKEMTEIAVQLESNVQNFIENLQSRNVQIPDFAYRQIYELDSQELKIYAEDLRNFRRKLREVEIHLESQDQNRINEYISLLKNIHKTSKKASIELEQLSTYAFNALNDAINITANYPVGDDNEPTFTAPANKPDIECFYEEFNAICEVTMLTSRSQWYNEGQPVMRHLRDFETKYTGKPNYCIFIAPKLHVDSVETFWVSVTYGYRGEKQNIIPITISQLIWILEILLQTKRKNMKFPHTFLRNLFDRIIQITNTVSNSQDWIGQIPKEITDWQNRIIHQ